MSIHELLTQENIVAIAILAVCVVSIFWGVCVSFLRSF